MSQTDPASIIHHLQQKLALHTSASHWYIGLSGGVDSVVLLHALSELSKLQPQLPSLTAIHINHRLNANADHWQQFCVSLCNQLAVPLISERVAVETKNGSLENAAREARYAVFKKHLKKNSVLLLAHHQDDQVETIFLRLLRGTGVNGMQGMPQQRVLGEGILFRPMLELNRAAIIEYSRNHRLDWVDDDSNQDRRFDRNYLRHEVLPIIEQRWPSYRETIHRFGLLANESQNLTDELAATDLEEHAQTNQQGLFVSKLNALSELRRNNVLRYWFHKKQLPLPGRNQQQQIKNLLQAKEDATPLVAWPGVELRRYQNTLYAMRPLPKFDPTKTYHWNGQTPLEIDGAGVLSVSALSAKAKMTQDQKKRKHHFRICFRQGGERCHPKDRNHSQSLKKLLQEYQVPPWLRERVPLIYCGDEMIAVADLWMEKSASTEFEAISFHWCFEN